MLTAARYSAQPMGLAVFGWLLIGTTLATAFVPGGLPVGSQMSTPIEI